MTPGTRLGPYEILAPLGAGGMGEVWRALDTRLGRDVAIKILPAAFAENPERLRRFEQEARATAALNHPNILAIFDVGTHEGQPYLVEELLEGETLRDRLAHGSLPVGKAVELAIQLAHGLAAAHEKDIVHRDLKPENLFLTSRGHIKILDFGLARLARSAAAEHLTGAATQSSGTGIGAVLGTVGYMAPEQVRGQPCDHRADIFALGCVLHEALSGAAPFRRSTPADTMAAILSEDPPSLATPGRGVPPGLQTIVRRCLEKQPGDRFTSAHDLALALASVSSPTDAVTASAAMRPRHGGRRWVVGAAALLLVVAASGAVWYWQSRQTRQVQEAAPNRVVVAVFENYTRDPALDHLSRMTSDWLTQTLSQVEGIEVVPSSSVLMAQPAGASTGSGISAPTALAAATGAGTVVSGSFQLQGSSLVLQASVTDVARQRLVLSVGPVSGPLASPLQAIDALAQRVAGAVATNAGFAHELGSRSPPMYEAYRELILGFELFLTDDTEALRHFEKATELDPGFLVPLMYQTYILQTRGEHTRVAVLMETLAARREELTPFGRCWLDGLKAFTRQRYYEGMQHMRAAARIAPRDPLTLHWIGYLALLANRPGETVETFGVLGGNPWGPHPLGVTWQWILCRAHHMLGEHEQELDEARRGRDASPDQLTYRVLEVRALSALGRVEEVQAVAEASQTLLGRENTAGDVLLEAAKELRAHGHEEPSRAMAGRASTWFGGRIKAVPAALIWRVGQLDAMRWAERWAEAERVARELSHLAAAGSPEAVDAEGVLAAVVARRGRRAEAERACTVLLGLTEPRLRAVATYRCAGVWALLGEQQRAVELLGESFALGRPYGIELHREIDLEPLRGYPPFEKLLKPKG